LEKIPAAMAAGGEVTVVEREKAGLGRVAIEVV